MIKWMYSLWIARERERCVRTIIGEVIVVSSSKEHKNACHRQRQEHLVLDVQHEEIVELLFIVPASKDVYTTSVGCNACSSRFEWSP